MTDKPITEYSSDMSPRMNLEDLKEAIADAILSDVLLEHESYQLQIYESYITLYLHNRTQCIRITIEPRNYKTGGPLEVK